MTSAGAALGAAPIASTSPGSASERSSVRTDEQVGSSTTTLVGTYRLPPVDTAPNPSPFAHTDQLWDPPSPVTVDYVTKVSDRFADVIADTAQLVEAGTIDTTRARERLRAVLADGTPPNDLGRRPSITRILDSSPGCISFETPAGRRALVRYDYVAEPERDAHNLNGTPWLLAVPTAQVDPCAGH
jgi:hypothetical protein